ncbi:unnamed protein product [Darwinula stevensoni]|uniref:Cilia- and flagella-associated protein 45 n=1 Tax=Darwinula stevensoni TaxID=69355 RepID=A0A7R8X649_9CRUS|nr:unnamed protein product [Darwinula stevensoni]CAG0881717.1 unnamed protein product [Darwinula stevensoni]
MMPSEREQRKAAMEKLSAKKKSTLSTQFQHNNRGMAADVQRRIPPTRSAKSGKAAISIIAAAGDVLRKSNSILINSKCRIIQDAQLKENMDARKRKLEEELMVDWKMIEKDQRLVREEKEMKCKKEAAWRKQALNVRKEMEDKQKTKIVVAEKLFQEWEADRAQAKALAVEIQEEKQRNREKKQLRAKELYEANLELQKSRQREQQREFLEETKAVAFSDGKVEQQAVLTSEKEERLKYRQMISEKLRLAREREVERENRERALREKRKEEEVAREWRARELAAATALRVGVPRGDSPLLRRKEEFLQEAVRLKEEERQAMLQQAAFAEHMNQEDDVAHKQTQVKYKKELEEQMEENRRLMLQRKRDREKQVAEELAAAFRAEEDLQRKLRLQVDQLRASKVPPQYVKAVEKKIQRLHGNPS